MTAVDSATGKPSTQTVQQVFINHDSDLLDVTLQSATGTSPVPAGSPAKQQQAALAAHGSRAPPATSPPVHETVRTTANHPWLSADRGWAAAGTLYVGEPVRRADGGMAVVVALRVVPGAAAMWDLTVSQVHTFAVGTGAYVVHNCKVTPNPKDAEDATKAFFSLRAKAQAEKFVVAVGHIQDASGIRRVIALSQDAWTNPKVTDDIVQGIAGEGTLILKDPTLLDNSLQASGHAHAEDYFAGYIRRNPGSSLRDIGTSWFGGGFCETCQRILEDL